MQHLGERFWIGILGMRRGLHIFVVSFSSGGVDGWNLLCAGIIMCFAEQFRSFGDDRIAYIIFRSGHVQKVDGFCYVLQVVDCNCSAFSSL